MLKVVLLSGSPRSKGNTEQVLQECARVIGEHGVEAEVVTLVGKKIESCIACNKCAELQRCVLDDGLNEIIDKLRSARGFIAGAPVYFGSARGDVMSALQRIGKVAGSSGRFLSGMVGGPVAVARRGAHTATLQEMLMFYLINDMIVPGSSYWNMVIGREKGEVWQDEEGMNTVRHFAANVAELVKKLN
jgi:multimeric flavodoxin WrbA